MAFEYPYQESPFSQSVSGLSLGMGHAHGLPNFDHQFPNMFDMSDQPQDLSTPGTSACSTSSLQAGERTETKPRLAKDEVARLERIFAENHKPNSNVKRKLAEEMRVEVARINNWFQNRRAKAKQEKKQEEFERAQQEQQNQTKSSSQDETTHQHIELFPADYDLQEQSSSSFSTDSGPTTTGTMPCHPQYDDPSAASLDSFDRSMEAARAAAQRGAFSNEHSLPTPRLSLGDDCLDDTVGGDRAPFPSSDDMDLPDDDWGNTFSDPFLLQQQAAHFQAEIDPPMDQDPLLNNLMGSSELTGVGSLLPSQLLSPGHSQTSSQAHDKFVSHFEQAEFPKPESNDEPQYQSQPNGQLRFGAPPSSINIAARRSKPRPAALGTTPRSNSYIGPRTLAHSPTINRSSPISPGYMRRIVSTTNLNSCVNMNGSRIQKSYPSSAQRSPINLHGFSDPKAFIDNNAHNIKRPSVTASNASNVHPPTPMSPQDLAQLQREMTSSSSSSDDTNLLSNTVFGEYFMHPEMADSNLASPPETPAFSLDRHPNHWSSYNIPDEPLHTPGTVNFGTDLQQYLSPLNSSQPNTPGLPPYLAANFHYSHGVPQYGFQASGSSSNEHLFPGANPRYGSGYMKSSPDSSKEFLFQNQTAKDYEAMSK